MLFSVQGDPDWSLSPPGDGKGPEFPFDPRRMVKWVLLLLWQTGLIPDTIT